MEPLLNLYLWDRLLTQVTILLKMLRRYCLHPELSAYEQVEGIQNLNAHN